MTLVETLIIVGIIAILSSVVLANISDAKKKARDKERVSDLQGIQLALRLYKDSEGSYPAYDTFADGIVIGDGGDIDSKLSPFFPSIPKDKLQEAMLTKFKYGTNVVYASGPMGPSGTSGSDVTYGYVYDSDYDNCTVSGSTGHKKVLYAKTMELSGSGNWATVCGGTPPGTNSYIIILK